MIMLASKISQSLVMILPMTVPGFNQAVKWLYTNNGNAAPGVQEQYRRKLFMPAGRYRMIANELVIPSQAHISGEGKFATVIYLDSTSSLSTLFQTTDSLGQTEFALGSHSAELPQDILLENMSIVCNNSAVLGALNSVSNITFKNCFLSLATADTGTMFDVNLLGTATVMAGFTFDNCEFNNYANIFDFTTDVSNINMSECIFENSLPNFTNTTAVIGNIQNNVVTSMPSVTLLPLTTATLLTLPLSTLGNSAFINYTLIQSGAIRVWNYLLLPMVQI